MWRTYEQLSKYVPRTTASEPPPSCRLLLLPGSHTITRGGVDLNCLVVLQCCCMEKISTSLLHPALYNNKIRRWPELRQSSGTINSPSLKFYRKQNDSAADVKRQQTAPLPIFLPSKKGKMGSEPKVLLSLPWSANHWGNTYASHRQLAIRRGAF